MYLEDRVKMYTAELKLLHDNSSSGKDVRHEHADELLVNFTRWLWEKLERPDVAGFDELLKAYEDVPKWYS